VKYIHTHPFNGPFSGTTWVSWYQKVKTNLDFTETRDSEWQWHQLGHMQVCTSLQTDNHASNPPLNFLHAGCPSCHPTSSVKVLKGLWNCIEMWKCKNSRVWKVEFWVMHLAYFQAPESFCVIASLWYAAKIDLMIEFHASACLNTKLANGME